MQVCEKCGQEYGDDFFTTKSGSRHYDTCTKCRAINAKQKMKKRRTYPHADIKAHLVDQCGGKCSCCGYDKFPEALDFYPLKDRRPLVPALINRYSYGASQAAWDKLVNEVQRSILLCRSCAHAARIGSWTPPATSKLHLTNITLMDT